MSENEDKPQEKEPVPEKKQEGQEAVAGTPGEAAAGTEAENAGKASLRKKRIIIIAAVVVVVLLSAVGAYFFIAKKHPKEDQEQSEKQEAPKQSIYVDLDDFIVNLNGVNGQASFLKLSVSLETDDPKSEMVIKSNMPKIRDSFQIYLRQMRAEDLRGSEGLFILREELLLRINKILYPVTIKDILFNELIVQ